MSTWVCWDRGAFLVSGSPSAEEEICWWVRPCTRWGHALACLPVCSSEEEPVSSFLLYGGRDGRLAIRYVYPPEVWTCSIRLPQPEGASSSAPSGSSSFEWRCGPLATHIRANGASVPVTPPGRFLHTMVTVGRTALVWGGYDEKEVFDDVHLLGIDTMSWSKLELEGEVPGARFAAAGVALRDGSALSYGGLSNEALQDGMRARWTKLHPRTGQPPTSRDGCTASLVKNKLYVIGGSEEEKEVFVYDIDAHEWRSISPPPGASVWPTLRSGHACAVVGDRYIVMFGGCTSEALCGDTYVFDTSCERWMQLGATDFIRGPVPRAGHSLVALADGRSVAMYGGETINFCEGEPLEMATLNDLHILTLPSHLFSDDE